MVEWKVSYVNKDTVLHAGQLSLYTKDSGLGKWFESIKAEHNAEIAALESRIAEVRMNTGCARGQHTTQFCAEVVARDEVISELLEMLRPSLELVNNAQVDIGADWELTLVASLYTRACEIAGRDE